MHAREPQSSGFQPSAAAKKTEGFSPRPFEAALPRQAVVSPTNPFPRRPHEVWMGESTGSATGNQEQLDAPGVKLDWSRISLYAEGQTPPEPPQWPRVQAKFANAHPDDPYDREADRRAEQVRSDDRADQEQSQPKQTTPLVQRQPDFSHVDWFSHAPQRRPIHPIQTKLTIGQPNDRYEQEADQVAEQVMSMPESASVQREMGPEEEEVQTKPLAATITPLVQREAMPEEEEALQTKASPTPYSLLPTPLIQREAMPEEEEVQTKPLANTLQRQEMPEEEAVQTKPSLQRATDGSLQAGGNLENRLNSSKGGGSPLPQDVKTFMESRFRTDFSQVRVHTDSEAVQMNRDLNAQAFTHKQDVYFGGGKAPGKDALTAHELTHVVQQTGAVQTKHNSEQPTVQMKCAACEKEDAEVQRAPNISPVSNPEIQRWSLFGDDEDKQEAEGGGSSGGGILDWAKEKVSGAVDTVTQAGSDAYDWAKDKASGAVDTVTQAGSNAYDWAKQQSGAAIDTVSSALVEAKKASLLTQISEAMGNIPGQEKYSVTDDQIAALNGHFAALSAKSQGLISLPDISGETDSDGQSVAASTLITVLQTLQSSVPAFSISPDTESSASDSETVQGSIQRFAPALVAGGAALTLMEILAIIAIAGIIVLAILAIILMAKKYKEKEEEKEKEKEKEKEEERRPPPDMCNKAIKVLEQFERLAEKLGKKIPPKRLEELNRKRDAGTITSFDLPGFLEFPGGPLVGMTLEAIRRLCGKG